MAYCVYKHTNKLDGKAYIGMCEESRTHQRWADGHGYYQQKVFGNAIKQYGWDSFDHDILFDHLTKQEAIDKESECIALYKTADTEYGYNVSIRGDKPFLGQHHTEDARTRISKKLKIYQKTAEHRKHISEKVRGVQHHNAKPVYQFSKDGKFIKAWPYMNAAANELSISKGNISRCCLGIAPSAGGYIWSYERG